MTSKKFDLLIMLWLVVIAALYAYVFHASYLGKPLIAATVYLVPSIWYLGVRKKKNWKKVIASTIVFGGLFGFFFEFIMEYTGSYNVTAIVFPKLFNVVPIDNIVAHMMMTCLTVTFYEHFIDREKHKALSKNLKFAVLPAIFAIALELIIFFNRPELLQLQYPYFYLGIAAILPTIFLGYKKPVFIKNMLETALFFFFVYFILELLAVAFNYWIYPGNYIGWVSFFQFTFPIEELFFWMLFYAASIVSYYELFIDEH